MLFRSNSLRNWSLAASKMIFFGKLKKGANVAATSMVHEAPTRAFPRGDGRNHAQWGQPGLGLGMFRQSSVFTVSLIEPNWLFTSMENATVQTLDVQMLFGDTSEPMDSVAGQPAQFSIIVSP